MWTPGIGERDSKKTSAHGNRTGGNMNVDHLRGHGSGVQQPRDAVLTLAFISRVIDHTQRVRQRLFAPYVAEIKGFDAIAPDAFAMCRDVDMLFFRDNTFESLPCGAGYTRVRGDDDEDNGETSAPTLSNSPTQSEASVTEHDAILGPVLRNREGSIASVFIASHYVTRNALPPPCDSVTWPARPASAVAREAVDEAALPAASTVPIAERDVFSPFYYNLETIEFNRNRFRRMPDLHRFQRVRSVRIMEGRFSTVRPGCPEWVRRQSEYESEVAQRQPATTSEPLALAPSTITTSTTVVNNNNNSNDLFEDGEDSGTFTDRRRRELARMRAYVAAAAHFCPHEALPVDQAYGAPPALIDAHRPPDPLHFRQPCSTVRGLTLSGNRIRSFNDLVGLVCYKALSVLDLSFNQIVDGEALVIILGALPGLVLLTLIGNPVVESFPNYRRRIIQQCERLRVLDEEPIFDAERNQVEACPPPSLGDNEAWRQVLLEEAAKHTQRTEDDASDNSENTHETDADSALTYLPAHRHSAPFAVSDVLHSVWKPGTDSFDVFTSGGLSSEGSTVMTATTTGSTTTTTPSARGTNGGGAPNTGLTGAGLQDYMSSVLGSAMNSNDPSAHSFVSPPQPSVDAMPPTRANGDAQLDNDEDDDEECGDVFTP